MEIIFWSACILAGCLIFIKICSSGKTHSNSTTDVPSITSTLKNQLHTLATIKGTEKDSKTTPIFKIHEKAESWIVSWNTRPGKFGSSNFQIIAYDAYGNPISATANAIGESSDKSIIANKTGEFYLQIDTMQPYQIEIIQSLPEIAWGSLENRETMAL